MNKVLYAAALVLALAGSASAASNHGRTTTSGGGSFGAGNNNGDVTSSVSQTVNKVFTNLHTSAKTATIAAVSVTQSGTGSTAEVVGGISE